MTPKYLNPVSIGRLGQLYDVVSPMPLYVRIMRRVRRGVEREEIISDRTNIDIQQKRIIQEKIDTIKEWVEIAEKTLI